MPILNQNALLLKLLDALASAGWSAAAVEKHKPFLVLATLPDGSNFSSRIFIWNCTHGGGAARAADEYRIQFTGMVPAVDPSRPTLLLGWHDGYGVFAAWDITKHDGQAGRSPSAQIKEQTLERAHTQAFATSERQNAEVVVAFRPEMLAEYVLSSRSLHEGGAAARDFAILNDVPDVTQNDVEAIADTVRREIIARIVRRYRASDFRRRVLTAYNNSCAVCGLQMKLVEAAHIDPVSEPTSTDETKNGIALCALHHTAYDRQLISFDEHYRVQISAAQIADLRISGHDGGAAEFRRALRPMISLPADRRDYPDRAYIRRSRTSRGWIA